MVKVVVIGAGVRAVWATVAVVAASWLALRVVVARVGTVAEVGAFGLEAEVVVEGLELVVVVG